MLGLTHCTTVHGRIFEPCTVMASEGPPAALDAGEIEVRAGAPRLAVGVDSVNGSEFEAPIEFDTVTVALPGKAASAGETANVSCVALTKVVVLGGAVPFQLTTESLVKFDPFTVSVKPVGLQYGEEAAEVVDADRDVIDGGVPGVAVIVKRTTLEISVVVVLLTFCVADWDEPGICTATCTVPVDVRSDAGTGAVSWTELTKVVTSCVPFHRISAPVVKPVPLAVMVKPWLPTVAVLGLTKVSTEEEVWMERFVL